MSWNHTQEQQHEDPEPEAQGEERENVFFDVSETSVFPVFCLAQPPQEFYIAVTRLKEFAKSYDSTGTYGSSTL